MGGQMEGFQICPARCLHCLYAQLPAAGTAHTFEMSVKTPLFKPTASVLIQKHHPYTGNLSSETCGDRRNAFPHCGDVLELPDIQTLHAALQA